MLASLFRANPETRDDVILPIRGAPLTETVLMS